MNEVPERYRNVINPWQTPKEIRLAVKFLDRMINYIRDRREVPHLLRHDRPLRDWSFPR